MQLLPVQTTANPGNILMSERRQRILFVDDEPLLTRLGEEFLKRLGYEAVAATSPEKALEIFGEGSFDAVITDLTMPGMSGIELAQAMIERQPTIPIILTTAFHQKLEGKNPNDLGFSALLLKPYTLGGLQKTLRDVLGGATA